MNWKSIKSNMLMAGALSHELNNQSMIISGYIQYLDSIKEPISMQALEKVCGGIRSAGDRLEEIASELSIIAGRDSIQPLFCKPSIILQDIVRGKTQDSKENQITYSESSDSANWTIISDNVKLQMIFTELLDNATSFSEPGSMITCKVSCIEGSAGPMAIEISNLLSDVSESSPSLDTVTTPYFSSQARKKIHRGTGLNLVIGLCTLLDIEIELSIDTKSNHFLVELKFPPEQSSQRD